jgi:hypothetical protein
MLCNLSSLSADVWGVACVFFCRFLTGIGAGAGADAGAVGAVGGSGGAGGIV